VGVKIGNQKIQCEEGYLYFIGKDGYVWAAPTKHNKTGKKKVGTEKIAKESGFMYYIGKDGFVAKAKIMKTSQEGVPAKMVNQNGTYEYWMKIGVENLRNNDYSSALSAFNKALEKSHSSNEILASKTWVVQCHVTLNNFNEALTLCDQIISQDPNNYLAFFLKGVCQGNLDKPELCINSILKSISLGIKEKELLKKAYMNLGKAYRKIGKFQESLGFLDLALAIDNKFIEALILKIVDYIELGDYTRAQELIEETLKIDPNDQKILKNLMILKAQCSNAQENNIISINTKPKKTFVPPIELKKESGPKGFASVAGMNKLKEKLQKEVIAVLKNPEKYKKFDVGLPNGILLFGPPGCGKTFIVQKLAEELGYNFMEVPPSSVGSKYIHETSANIAKIFREAKDKAPTILFFDEFEALVPKRESLGSGGQFKNEEINEFLQHLNNASKDNILVVGATNQPTLIDSGITRSGRFDRLIYVGPPDHDARKELFKIGLTKTVKSDDIDFDELADKTENYSSSDITLIVQDSKRLAADQDLDEINQALLIYAVEKSKPSLTKSQIENYLVLAKDER